MIGSGKIGTQPIAAASVLPAPVVIAAHEPSTDSGSKDGKDDKGHDSGKDASGTPDIIQGAKKPSSASTLVSSMLAISMGLLSSLVWM